MRKHLFSLILTLSVLFISCGGTGTEAILDQGALNQPCFDDGTCIERLICIDDICVSERAWEQQQEEGQDDNFSDDNHFNEADDNNYEQLDAENEFPDECEDDSIGKNCSLDDECGKCNICVMGKCSKGCLSDDDCKMYIGVKCNKKLNRCLNIYGSLQACGETKCPTGCCYADQGFLAVKCLTTPEAHKCGLCPNGEIYMPDQSKCIPAVCSTIEDNCPSLNSDSTDPDPDCFECKSGEFICKEKPVCSNVSPVNAFTCNPAGAECEPGLMSNCCSGLPCVDGYCY